MKSSGFCCSYTKRLDRLEEGKTTPLKTLSISGQFQQSRKKISSSFHFVTYACSQVTKLTLPAWTLSPLNVVKNKLEMEIISICFFWQGGIYKAFFFFF